MAHPNKKNTLSKFCDHMKRQTAIAKKKVSLKTFAKSALEAQLGPKQQEAINAMLKDLQRQQREMAYITAWLQRGCVPSEIPTGLDRAIKRLKTAKRGKKK